MIYVYQVNNHNGYCLFPKRGTCCRASQGSHDIQPIQAKEEIHHWERHIATHRVWVMIITHNRVLLERSEPQLKRCSSAGTATVLSAHRLSARIIETTVHFVCFRVTSMTEGQEIG